MNLCNDIIQNFETQIKKLKLRIKFRVKLKIKEARRKSVRCFTFCKSFVQLFKGYLDLKGAFCTKLNEYIIYRTEAVRESCSARMVFCNYGKNPSKIPVKKFSFYQSYRLKAVGSKKIKCLFYSPFFLCSNHVNEDLSLQHIQ